MQNNNYGTVLLHDNVQDQSKGKGFKRKKQRMSRASYTLTSGMMLLCSKNSILCMVKVDHLP